MTTIGIDLGTTSIKICIAKNGILVLENSVYHNANIEGQHGVQNASEILKVSEELIKTTWKDFQITHPGEKCKSLRIAGQMHGIVLWQGHKLTKGEVDCSPLYTWMYPNCPEKGEKLPKPSRPVFPGFGGLTLMEMKDFGSWDRCGTIMDLFACYLCKVEEVEMSWQLAESWGYCSDSQWDECLVEATKGKINLPKIIDDDRHVVGSMNLNGFENVSVLISIGDLQGSIRSVADGNNDAAYIIIGTSSQICMISKTTTNITTVDRLPYSLDRCILAGRSMNGGNAVDGFLEMVCEWAATLDASGSNSINKVDMERLMNAVDEDVTETTVKVKPTFIQERGFPITGAAISGLERSTDVVQVLRALCSGVIDNLVTLFPLTNMYSLGIRRLFLVGKAKKPRFSKRISQLCKEVGIEAIDAVNDTSAAYGAAIF